MKICISADHGGFDLKKIIIDHVKSLGFETLFSTSLLIKSNSLLFIFVTHSKYFIIKESGIDIVLPYISFGVSVMPM